VLTNPQHPYTQGLLAASPTLERAELQPIPGSVPQLTDLPLGCAFAPRCVQRRAECDTAVPPLFPIPAAAGGAEFADHSARCVLVADKARHVQEIAT
jgi:oligopeptide/dipeptide ABC transporter ATP-binding protein